MKQPPLLVVHGLTVCFARGDETFPVVEDVSLTVAAGERVALVGASGSGKSLAALALLGLTTPGGRITAGQVEINGVDILGVAEARRRMVRRRVVSLIPQEAEAALNPVLSVESHLHEFLLSLGISNRQERTRRINEELTAVGLDDPEILVRFPHQLSGGQRQRVLTAMTLLGNPELVIADEPTSNLDMVTQALVLQLLSDRCRQRGSGLLMITHDLEVAAAVADRAIVMTGGCIVEDGPMHCVLHHPKHPYTRTLVAARPPQPADGSRESGGPNSEART
jgi:peptide/nickel transport system ATP-binding protein